MALHNSQLCLALCVSLTVCIFMSVACVSMCVCSPTCVRMCLYAVCVCVCVSVCASLCVYICVCVYQCYVYHICHWCKLYIGNILICQFSWIFLLILFYVEMHVQYRWIQWNHKGSKVWVCYIVYIYQYQVSLLFISCLTPLGQQLFSTG